MTDEQVKALAQEAATSACSAHGEEGCPADTAFEFIRQMKWEECEGTDEEARAVWNSMDLDAAQMAIFRLWYSELYQIALIQETA